MKFVSLFLLVLGTFSGLANARETEVKSIFTKIADEAQVANGSTSIDNYDKTLKKPALVEMSRKDLEQEYWEDCGPWKNVTSRREVIQAIEKIENMGEKTKVVERLNALYDKDKIVAVFGTFSNTKVECSLSWFHIYGSDGTVLEMKYNIGD